MSEVFVIRCKDYSEKNVKAAFEILFSRKEVRDIFHSGENILLKPNLLAAKEPEKAVTTHPEVFLQAAASLLKAGVNVSYGDCPATDSTQKALRISGIKDAAEKLGIKEADFTGSFETDYPEGKIAKKFRFVNAVRDTDAVVSIAKFKTHALTRFTGAVKNQFGLVPGLLKAKDHVRYPNEKDFADMLCDLNKCLSPGFYIMDAVTGMEGNGPAAGTPRDIGYIMASKDPVALDSVCIMMTGLDSMSVRTIRAGHESGLGTGDKSKIEIIILDEGDEVRGSADKIIDSLVIPDFKNSLPGNSSIELLNSFAAPVVKKLIMNRPYILHDLCTRCKKCIEVCPVEPKAVFYSPKKRRIKYSYEKCIRCFCCQETCPFSAIDVRKAPLWFLMK